MIPCCCCCGASVAPPKTFRTVARDGYVQLIDDFYIIKDTFILRLYENKRLIDTLNFNDTVSCHNAMIDIFHSRYGNYEGVYYTPSINDQTVSSMVAYWHDTDNFYVRGLVDSGSYIAENGTGYKYLHMQNNKYSVIEYVYILIGVWE